MLGIMEKIKESALKILRDLKGETIGLGAWVAAVCETNSDFNNNTVYGVVSRIAEEGGPVERVKYGQYRMKKLPETGGGRVAIDAALTILKTAQGESIQRKHLLEKAWDKIKGNSSGRRPVDKSASDTAIDVYVLAPGWRGVHNIEKVGFGLYRVAGKKHAQAESRKRGTQSAKKKGQKAPLPENKFCAPFARHLVNELGECTKAVKADKPTTRLRWANPDVVGVFKPPATLGHFNFPTQIVAAEIKSKDSDRSRRAIEAFGQACAYKAFAHKAYVVIPKEGYCSDEDIGRLQYLCNEFGIGLCLFDPTDEGTDFNIRVRARSHNPDPEFVKIFIGKLEKSVKEELELE